MAQDILLNNFQITTAHEKDDHPVKGGFQSPTAATITAKLSGADAGATVTVWVQSSIDGDVFFDVACFQLNSTVPKVVCVDGKKSITAPVDLLDKGLAINSVQEGFLGESFRVKTRSDGTFTGTTLTIGVATKNG